VTPSPATLRGSPHEFLYFPSCIIVCYCASVKKSLYELSRSRATDVSCGCTEFDVGIEYDDDDDDDCLFSTFSRQHARRE